jgi:hypothetical protein
MRRRTETRSSSCPRWSTSASESQVTEFTDLSGCFRSRNTRRPFFSTRFARVLDASGYARLKHWKIYAEEGLARREVALWLGAESLAVEFAGDTLARYAVEYSARTNRLR